MAEVTTTTTVTEKKTILVDLDGLKVEDHPENQDYVQDEKTEIKNVYTNEPANEGALTQSTEATTQKSDQSSKSTSTRRIAVDFNSDVAPEDQVFEKYAVLDGKLKYIPLNYVHSALVDLNMNPSKSKIQSYIKKNFVSSMGMSNMQFKEVCKLFQFSIADIDKLIDIFLILDTDNDLQMSKDELRDHLSSSTEKGAIVGPSFENLYGDMEPQGTGIVTIRAFLLAYFPDPVSVDEALRRRGLLPPEPEPEPEEVPEEPPVPERDFDAEFADIEREEQNERKKLVENYNSQLDVFRKDMNAKLQALIVKKVEPKKKQSCGCCCS